MPRISACDRCQRYAHSEHLVCAVHPTGPLGEVCLDFAPLVAEEQWEPPGVSYYDGELILHRPRYTREEQLEILDTHPLFTGVCPRCGAAFDRENPPKVHWDCAACGWLDDSV